MDSTATLDSTTYATAYQANYVRTCRFMGSHGMPYDKAQDIAQAAWARAWEYRDQLKNPALILTWVNSIALNLWRDELRKKATFTDEIPVLSIKAKHDAHIDAQTVLALCKPKERNILKMFYIQGYSVKEISEMAGLALTTIRVELFRARQSCKEHSRSATRHNLTKFAKS